MMSSLEASEDMFLRKKKRKKEVSEQCAYVLSAPVLAASSVLYIIKYDSSYVAA